MLRPTAPSSASSRNKTPLNFDKSLQTTFDKSDADEVEKQSSNSQLLLTRQWIRSHLSRVQLIDALLTSHRYPVAKPTKRPCWSLTTMRSLLARPLLAEPCCGATLLLWKRWRKTPSGWTATGPLSCRFPTQLPLFSLQTQEGRRWSLSKSWQCF